MQDYINRVLSSTARNDVQEFTLGLLRERWSAPGGRQLSVRLGCYRPNIHSSPCIITQPLGWHSFSFPRRVEGWVDLDNAVSSNMARVTTSVPYNVREKFSQWSKKARKGVSW